MSKLEAKIKNKLEYLTIKRCVDREKGQMRQKQQVWKKCFMRKKMFEWNNASCVWVCVFVCVCVCENIKKKSVGGWVSGLALMPQGNKKPDTNGGVMGVKPRFSMSVSNGKKYKE